MASSSSGAAATASNPPAAPKRKAAATTAAEDPILRNALRYTVSAREYAALHKYILSRSAALRRRAPSVETVTRIMNGDAAAGPTAAAAGSSGSSSRPGPSGRRRSSKDQQHSAEGEGQGKGKEVDRRPVGADALDREKEKRPAVMVGADDFNARAVRHAIRVFVATGVTMKVWTAVMRRISGKSAE